MNRFDFTPYRRSTVGFDRLFDLLENQARSNAGENYPPFNIERRSEDSYRITLAVAGFKPADIDITAQQNLLVVQGKKAEDTPSGQFLHVGMGRHRAGGPTAGPLAALRAGRRRSSRSWITWRSTS